MHKLKLFMLALLATCTIASAQDALNAGAAADKTPQEKFSNAVALMQAHKYADALPLLDDLSTSSPTPTVFWNLGLSAGELGNYAKAKQAWLAYRGIAPNNWQGRAKLVQTYQALGELDARDKELSALMALWKDGTDKDLSAQAVFCREQFRHDGRKVMALEYFNPSGPTMVVYSFIVLNEAGRQDFKISLGSYESTNQIALELGERPKDKRLYHLDLYRPNEHATYGWFLGQPSYDVIRSAVVNVLSGKVKPSSSSTR